MPKMKTHKGTAKRFRLTKKGKLMRMKAGRNPLAAQEAQGDQPPVPPRCAQHSEEQHQAGRGDRRQGRQVAVAFHCN